jgi:hypothetical protein
VRGRRGRPVEEDGKSQETQALAGLAGQPDRIFHGGAFEGHEGEHVEHAHAGMLARLGCEVEFCAARLRQGSCAGEHGFLFAGEREDAPVVVGIRVETEDAHAGDRADGPGEA